MAAQAPDLPRRFVAGPTQAVLRMVLPWHLAWDVSLPAGVLGIFMIILFASVPSPTVLGDNPAPKALGRIRALPSPVALGGSLVHSTAFAAVWFRGWS